MAQPSYSIKDFKTLEIMTKIRDLTKSIYKTVEQFPPCEKDCAAKQIRRSVTSIGANLAEGNTQMYPNKELTYLNNAIGSLSETRYWIMFARDTDYISKEDYEQLEAKCLEITKMLYGCVRRIKQSQQTDCAV